MGVDGSIKFWEHTPSKGLIYHIMIVLDQEKMTMGPLHACKMISWPRSESHEFKVPSKYTTNIVDKSLFVL
jgi:hypothetical protein